MIKLFRWLLLPLSLLYQGIIITRNLLFDFQFLKSKSFPIPTIVIGNLAIGGTGKSPMTEYIVTLLKEEYKLATLSRGYGRKTKGFKYVEVTDNAVNVGDEPLQFKHKFPSITVAVCEDRCAGMDILQHEHDLVILDDAYQHRKLKPGFSILLFEFQSLFTPFITLPTGNFRDDIRASKRADIIVITKCPLHINDEQKRHIEHRIRPYNTCPIFYSQIAYSLPKELNTERDSAPFINQDIILFCGIANPMPLVNYLENNGNRVQLIQFPDHHNYTQSDFDKVIEAYKACISDNKMIVTTEKDKQRVKLNVFQDLPVFFIPITLDFGNLQRDILDQFILRYVSSSLHKD